jgi:hypothetical protein
MSEFISLKEGLELLLSLLFSCIILRLTARTSSLYIGMIPSE